MSYSDLSLILFGPSRAAVVEHALGDLRRLRAARGAVQASASSPHPVDRSGSNLAFHAATKSVGITAPLFSCQQLPLVVMRVPFLPSMTSIGPKLALMSK